MSIECKERLEQSKPKTILLKMTDKAHGNVTRQQKRFKKKTGGRISQVDLINQILETATL